jgi:hypothetical protein
MVTELMIRDPFLMLLEAAELVLHDVKRGRIDTDHEVVLESAVKTVKARMKLFGMAADVAGALAR